MKDPVVEPELAYLPHGCECGQRFATDAQLAEHRAVYAEAYFNRCHTFDDGESQKWEDFALDSEPAPAPGLDGEG